MLKIGIVEAAYWFGSKQKIELKNNYFVHSIFLMTFSIIYGLIHFDDQKALEFANAACALKHTILGDANLVSPEEVLEVIEGSTGGRIKR